MRIGGIQMENLEPLHLFNPARIKFIKEEIN